MRTPTPAKLKLSLRKWAEELNVSASSLSRWLKEAEVEVSKGGLTLHQILQALEHGSRTAWCRPIQTVLAR